MTNQQHTKTVPTGKVLFVLHRAAAWRVLLLTLMAMISIEANAAASRSWLNAAEPETSEELERYAGSFDAFHSAVLSFMDGCKTLGSVYQATLSGGEQSPAAALADGAYADILQCIEESQEEIRARYRDLPHLTAESDAAVGPAVRNYLRTVDQIFEDLKPTQAEGVRESITAYDLRFSRMQQAMTTAADDVLAAAGWTD